MNISSRLIGNNIYEATDGTTSLIYAPLKNIVAEKWHAFAPVQRNIIRAIPDKYTIPQNTLAPTVLELDMGHACNLNCVYCSVNSNDSKDNDRDLRMTFPMAKIAIDRVIDSSISENDPFAIVFIGKGEPTLNWAILVQCVNYINEQKHLRSAKGKTVVVTNGIVSGQKARWLAKNIDHIALSWDGDRETQNSQRPLLKKEGSYPIVERTAAILKEESAYFEIRTTWTAKSVHKMPEFTEKFVTYNPFGLNYQPLLLTGKASDLTGSKPHADAFVENFIKSKRVAEKSGVLVMMPSVDITRLNRKFCHAYEGTGFHLSANGALTACECVFGDEDDAPGRCLTYGKIINGDVVIANEKIVALKSIRVDSIPGCHNCFVRWHCAGGCLNTHLQTCDDPLGERNNLECYLTRSIVWETLKLELEG